MEQKNEKLCHICKVPLNEEGSSICSAVHTPSQPAIPVEKVFGRCEDCGMMKNLPVLNRCGNCYMGIEPSTPHVQEGWEKEFDEEYVWAMESVEAEMAGGVKTVKDFIKKIEQEAYERGKKEEHTRFLNQKANAHDEEIRLTERARIEGIVTKKIAIHKQLDGEFIGSIAGIKLGVKEESPHSFVVENLEDIKEAINRH